MSKGRKFPRQFTKLGLSMKSIGEASLVAFIAAAAAQQTRFSLFLTPLLVTQSIKAFYKRPQENVQPYRRSP